MFYQMKNNYIHGLMMQHFYSNLLIILDWIQIFFVFYYFVLVTYGGKQTKLTSLEAKNDIASA